ncbi:MAG: DNA-protecting protein DprA [Bacteroidetes bacterium]|nr:DNA-protecting protein DprA [Bacteroidota bacterium]
MSNDLLYQIALTLVPGIGDVRIKLLIEIFGEARAVFKAPRKQLEKIENIGTVAAGSIRSFADFKRCEKELQFIEKFKITPLFITDAHYPKRLMNCYDNPALLYYRGSADLNKSKIISIVGTRNNTHYGKQVCEQLIADLKNEQIIIVSGLAFGIDTIAHKSALKENIPTVAVLAHGLDRIYPSQNKMMARQMVDNGGLLTDFPSETKPDRQNFPKRNRIAAGICDALVVIESGKKGGSLITAELGYGYNKDVFAFPGRSTDVKSEGCNFLIQQNKAALINNADDLLTMMNWKQQQKPVVPQQRSLFIELSADEKKLVDLLQEKGSMHIDELFTRSGLSSSSVAGALLMLEMQGVIASLPGKVYQLL